MSNSLSFLSGKCVDQEVNGQQMRFYPVSLRLAFRMRSFLAPIAKALTVLLPNEQDDTRLTGYENRSVKQADGTEMQTTEVGAIRPEILQQINSRRERAIEDLVMAVTSEENANLIAELIMDSLRDDFPRKPSPSQIQEFREEMDIDSLLQALAGFGKANKKIFDPFLDKVAPSVRRAAEDVVADVKARVLKPEETPTG